MAIINNPTPPVLTLAQKQAKVKSRGTSSTNILFRQMLAVFLANMKDVWANEDGLTPQQAIDAYGPDAGDAVRLADLLKTTINAANPGTITANTPATLTTNLNGTVTVG